MCDFCDRSDILNTKKIQNHIYYSCLACSKIIRKMSDDDIIYKFNYYNHGQNIMQRWEYNINLRKYHEFKFYQK